MGAIETRRTKFDHQFVLMPSAEKQFPIHYDGIVMCLYECMCVCVIECVSVLNVVKQMSTLEQ